MNCFASERGQYEYGKVAHALAAGMERLLREYLVLVAQLENQFLQVGRHPMGEGGRGGGGEGEVTGGGSDTEGEFGC